MDKRMELAQLLARFKLQVKRSLGEAVDLEKLTRDAAYAKERLQEVENAADDEDLLVLVMRVRDLLMPPPLQAAGEVPAAGPAPEAPAVESRKETRSYLMGARAW